MNYVIRITGPGVDHQVLVNSAEDFEALELIIAKMRKHFEAETSVDVGRPGGDMTAEVTYRQGPNGIVEIMSGGCYEPKIEAKQ